MSVEWIESTIEKLPNMRCEDCLDKIKQGDICTIKSRTTDFEKILCNKCAMELLSTKSKHFYCMEHE